MAKRQPFTFESNVEVVAERIHKAPYNVMRKIGSALVREIKSTTLRQHYKRRTGTMDKSLQHAWGWSKETGRDRASLQIGFKAFYAPLVMGKEADPIKPVVARNAELIKKMVAEALAEIEKQR